jgi:putative Holliday junction resolvase
MRILALDVGERRIGVAVSDPTQTLARSLLVLDRRRVGSVMERVGTLVQEQGVQRVVVGYPLSLGGGVSAQTERVRLFAEALAQALDVPVELWDERYSTVEAESILRGRGMRSLKRRRWVDATAAAVILQDYLDALARQRERDMSTDRTGHGDGEAP